MLEVKNPITILTQTLNYSNDPAMDIGTIIRNRRQTLRSTQQSLSEMSGVSVRMIKAIEGGYANPSVGTLEKILNVLGLQLAIIDKQEFDDNFQNK